MKSIVCSLALAAAVLSPAVAQAQNAGLTANFGEIRLNAGFTPDPYRASITAGGSIDAYTDTNLPGSCVGNISAAPDFEVTYRAGSLPLVFRTRSSTDTTLIINGPDGRWYCDDDSGGALDPKVVITNPQSGRYDVWVGTYGDDMVQSTLQVTEVD